MTRIMEDLNPMLHVRFEGRSYRIPIGALDLGSLSTDREIKHSLAGYLNVAPAKFSAYVVERHDNGNITVRPEAVFG